MNRTKTSVSRGALAWWLAIAQLPLMLGCEIGPPPDEETESDESAIRDPRGGGVPGGGSEAPPWPGGPIGQAPVPVPRPIPRPVPRPQPQPGPISPRPGGGDGDRTEYDRCMRAARNGGADWEVYCRFLVPGMQRTCFEGSDKNSTYRENLCDFWWRA